MTGKIPRSFIDDLIARTDIVELIDARVRLKKAGRNYQACCPFHNEKSPSFTVAPDKQFYHCFGCGAHGNVISFLMEYDKLDFVDAIEEIAATQGLEVPREQGNHTKKEQGPQIKADYEIMQQAALFFYQQTQNNTHSKKIAEYLASRGLDAQTVEKFQIGYAPEDWDALLKYLGKSQQAAHQLRDLGMLIENDNKRLYDRFRDRLMFPILDRRGKCIGFGGRVLSNENSPKYLNSPETRIFHKGRELYGLHQARQANRRLDRLLVVEGYMDVVALSQAGIHYAVASLGTATTPEQIQLIFRYSDEIICCYDGDKAGRSAAWRALENALPYLTDKVKMRFVFLPDGEDPDTLVKQIGQQAFEKIIDNAEPIEVFLFQQLAEQANINSLQGKAKLSELMQPMLEKLPEGEFKYLLSTKLNQTLGKSAPADKLTHNIQAAKNKAVNHNTSQNKKSTPVRRALALLLDSPQLATAFSQITEQQLQLLAELSIPGIALLVEVLLHLRNHPQHNAAQIIEAWRDNPNAKMLAKVIAWEHGVQEENKQNEFLDSMEFLLKQFIENRKEVLKTKAAMKLITAQEQKELMDLLKLKSK